MSRLSFVVPTKNSARTLGRCLMSLRAQTHDDIEIIVVDNHSTDETMAIANELAHVVETIGPERSAQRNRGAALASGDVVAFIDSDMYLTVGVGAAAVEAIESGRCDGVIVPERSIGEGFFARCRAHEKELYVGNPDVEAARFFPTDRVRAIGGYREDLRAGEDWDLSDRFEAAGGRLGRIDDRILHDDGRVSLIEMFRKKRYYGESFQHYLATREHADRRQLSRPGLFADPGPLLRRPVLTGGLFVLKAVETTGLAAGVMLARSST